MVEEYLARTKTAISIEHDVAVNAKLKKPPAFFDCRWTDAAPGQSALNWAHGEVAERLNAAVLKTVRP